MVKGNYAKRSSQNSSTEKPIIDQKINLDENDKAISEESELVEIFRNYFENIVENLNIERQIFSQLHTDLVLNIIRSFE